VAAQLSILAVIAAGLAVFESLHEQKNPIISANYLAEKGLMDMLMIQSRKQTYRRSIAARWPMMQAPPVRGKILGG
jgi:hypothetical protein